MEKLILDQLEDPVPLNILGPAFEMALFGTGIMKGPFALEKVR